jgi:hypothetical protein
MKTKYTPGPWEIKSINFEELQIVSPEYVIATMETGTLINDEKFEKEQKANALLIASAPDLLEALKMAKEFFELVVMPEGPEEDKIYPAVYEAIKKATGG